VRFDQQIDKKIQPDTSAQELTFEGKPLLLE
jgi:hypothetical protein